MIAFVTWSGEPAMSGDDERAAAACRRRGMQVDAVPWDLPADWQAYDAMVVRSTWNYHRAPAAFAAWIDRLEAAKLPVWNPTRVLRWNADKRYLLELERAGVRIPETMLVPRGRRASLADMLRERGWASAVVKPAVSANAFLTMRVDAGIEAETALGRGLSAAQRALDDAVRERDMLVQQLLPEIADGELSLMFFGGEFSHAVEKRPRPGEFRVQESHGGTARPRDVDAATIDVCKRILAHVPGPTLYARVDGIMTSNGFVLVELEAIEPSLFLEHDPCAGDRFAAAIDRIACGH